MSALRLLLQETAVHASLLEEGAHLPALHDWQARCTGLVERLKQAMGDHGYAPDVVEEVGLLQCVLLDVLTLRRLSEEQRSAWAKSSLQVIFHAQRDGTAVVRQRLDALLSSHVGSSPLWDAYVLFCALGLPVSDQSRRKLDTAVDAGALAPAEKVHPAAVCSHDASMRRPARVRANPWLWALGASGVALAMLWGGMHDYLGNAVNRLPVIRSADVSGHQG